MFQKSCRPIFRTAKGIANFNFTFFHIARNPSPADLSFQGRIAGSEHRGLFFAAGLFKHEERLKQELGRHAIAAADLSSYSQSELDEIALRLNQQPGKTLGFQSRATRTQDSSWTAPRLTRRADHF